MVLCRAGDGAIYKGLRMTKMFLNDKFLGLLGAAAVVGVVVYLGQAPAPAQTVLADGSINPLLVQTVLADRMIRPQLDQYEIALTQLQLDLSNAAQQAAMIDNTPFATATVAGFDTMTYDMDVDARLADLRSARDAIDEELASMPKEVLVAADKAMDPASRQAAIVAMQHSLCDAFASGGLPPGCTTKQD